VRKNYAFFLAALLSAFLVSPDADAKSPLGQGGIDVEVLELGSLEETGGQNFRISSESDINGVIALSVSPGLVPIVSASGALSDESRTFSIPVDSSMSRAVFSISADSAKFPSISVWRPSGKRASQGDPGVMISSFTSGTIVIVDAPETGTWQLRVRGIGAFSARVMGDTPIQLTRFDFVTLTGRPGHEGFEPIDGEPLIGIQETVLAELVGPFSTAEFHLIDALDNLIRPLELTQMNPNAAADQFVGSMTVPSEPFRVAVRGKDNTGAFYQRVFPALFRAQSVEVSVGNVIPDLFVGSKSSMDFTVRNVGNPDTFEIVVADTHSFVSSVQPTMITLDNGAMGTVRVDLSVPPETPVGTTIEINATATSIANPRTTNGTSLNLAISNFLIP